MKKRIISLLLVLTFMLSMVPSFGITVSATSDVTSIESEAVITVEEIWGNPGKTVDLDLILTENPGILGATITISWDENLTLVADASGEAVNHMTYTSPSRYVASGTNFVWFGNEVDEAIDGTILTLTFQVSESAQNNDILPVRVTYTLGDVIDENDNDVILNITDGSVRVITYQPGDVTGDGRVNARDLVRLSQYISDGCKTDPEGYNAEVVEGACDVTGDGRVNARDLIKLSQYISDGSQTNPDGYNAVLKPAKIPECQHSNVQETLAKVAGCTEAGNIAYWYCADCGKYYRDADCTAEISFSNTVIEATGHTYSLEWTNDTTHHWHKATCEHSVEISDYSAHSFDEGVCTICAYTQIPTYIVTFVDYNNTIIDIQEVQAGLNAVAPDNPTRANYSFVGWDTSFDNVSEDITVKATYIRQYTVTFVDYDGTVLETQVVNSGSNAIAPSHPTRTGYDSNGWDKAYTNITANTTVTALYKIKTFTVTFKMPDGTVIPYVDYKGVEHSTQTVEYGSCAEAPNYSDIFTELYFDWDTTSMKKFSGWDKALTNITNDIVVTAEYNDYYNQPVIAIEQLEKTLSVKIYMPEATHLYALDFSFDWTGSIGISNYFIDETSNVLYLIDNISKSIDYNNKQKTFHYSWTCAKGVKVPNNDEYFDVVETTFSTSGGSQLDVESIQKDCTLVFGANSDLPIEQLVVINPIVVIK